MIKNVLFDLDGTITDPALGITNSVMYALKRYDIEVKDRKELYKFIGPPLAGSFSKYYGFSEKESVKAVEIYREYFSEKGLFENKVYTGIEEVFKNLSYSNIDIYLATSKPHVFAEKILEYFELKKYFSGVVGSELNGDRVEKEKVIEFAIEKYDIQDALMVGDREFDIMGAKKNNLQSIGVLYGYGSYDELKNAGADYIVDSVDKMGKLIMEIS